MGITLSTAALTFFEIVNECYIALGSGVWGIGVLLNHGLKNQKYAGTFCLSVITAASLIYLLCGDEIMQADKKKVVVISGCDSGLGFSMALHLSDKGFLVLAGCLDSKSDGAEKLMSAGLDVFELNVTDVESVQKAVYVVRKVLEERAGNELWCLINNAGVMVFAEFEWQTDALMYDQINVNLIGNMRMTKGFAPLLRQYKARLINISSHCALESLPGLAVYGASKAAIKGLTDSLRVEFSKYGVRVISFIPGSFPTQSNIFAKQIDYVYEMRSSFTKEQEDFYGEYFQRYNSYLNAIANPNPARKLNYPDLYLQLDHALLSKNPKHRYKIEPLRYCIYHALFKISPVSLRDYFVEMFVRMPKYTPSSYESNIKIDTLMSMRSNFDGLSLTDKTLSAGSWSESSRAKINGSQNEYHTEHRDYDNIVMGNTTEHFMFDRKDSEELLDDVDRLERRITCLDLTTRYNKKVESAVTSSKAFL